VVTDSPVDPVGRFAVPPPKIQAEDADREGMTSSSPPDRRVRAELAGYPRVAGCRACHDFAREHLLCHSVPVTVAATLAHHDSGHLEDYLTVASQHFA